MEKVNSFIRVLEVAVNRMLDSLEELLLGFTSFLESLVKTILMALALFVFFFLIFPFIVLHHWAFKSFYEPKDT